MRNKKVELLISIDHTGQRVYQSSRNKKIMPVVIYTDDESGAQNIDISRQRTNTSNLEWGIRCWREIIAIDTEANPNFKVTEPYKNNVWFCLSDHKGVVLLGGYKPITISWVFDSKVPLETSCWLIINFAGTLSANNVPENPINKQKTDTSFKLC